MKKIKKEGKKREEKKERREKEKGGEKSRKEGKEGEKDGGMKEIKKQSKERKKTPPRIYQLAITSPTRDKPKDETHTSTHLVLVRIHSGSITSKTRSGGLLRTRTSTRSFLSRALIAFSADSSPGTASPTSCVTSSFRAPTASHFSCRTHRHGDARF